MEASRESAQRGKSGNWRRAVGVLPKGIRERKCPAQQSQAALNGEKTQSATTASKVTRHSEKAPKVG